MTSTDSMSQFRGRTAAEIADSIRDLMDADLLLPGDVLPSVRALAASLGVNRNTVVAGYGQLVTAGLLTAQGRAGTKVADSSRPAAVNRADLCDIGDGNPDPAFIPTPALSQIDLTPALYGAPAMDPNLLRVARRWFADEVPSEPTFSVASGGVDAVDRLLSTSLVRGDGVGLEDPCVPAYIHAVRQAGCEPVAIAVDDQGMTVSGLAAALERGVRAVVLTPRAQNPTGDSLTGERAAQLRQVLAGHRQVLVIADDHYSMLSADPWCSVISDQHHRWAVVRSVSKFLGPDLSVAVIASDRRTGERLARRSMPGTSWVSHLLQRLVASLLDDAEAKQTIKRAGERYAGINHQFAELAAAAGLNVSASAGFSLWFDTGIDSGDAVARLAERGWLARSGADFRLDLAAEETHLRLTVHRLTDGQRRRLVNDLVELVKPSSG